MPLRSLADRFLAFFGFDAFDAQERAYFAAPARRLVSGPHAVASDPTPRPNDPLRAVLDSSLPKKSGTEPPHPAACLLGANRRPRDRTSQLAPDLNFDSPNPL